jgi:TPR repeat protein
MDQAQASNFLILGAHEKSAAVQIAFAALLSDGKGVSEDRIRYRHGTSLVTGDAGDRDIADGFRYLKCSSETGSPDGQFALACLADNGIAPFAFSPPESAGTQGCCDRSPAGATRVGWCRFHHLLSDRAVFQPNRGAVTEILAPRGMPIR